MTDARKVLKPDNSGASVLAPHSSEVLTCHAHRPGSRFWLVAMFCSVLISVASCYPTEPPAYIEPIDSNFTSFSNFFAGGLGGGSAYTNVWSGNTIYSATPIRYRVLGQNRSLLIDSVPFSSLPLNVDSLLYWYYAIRLNSSDSKLLGVHSTELASSDGALDEFDLRTWERTELVNESMHVSHAVYGNGDSIFFFSKGELVDGVRYGSGYYLYQKNTGEVSLLLEHHNRDGLKPSAIAGFDYCPSRNVLLIPTATQGQPILEEYNLSTGEHDTLKIDFEYDTRWDISVRYDHRGERLLYSRNERSVMAGVGWAPSDVGIITIASQTKQELHPEPYHTARNVIFFPDWSPDEKSIVFSHAVVMTEPPGHVGGFQTTIWDWMK